MGRVPLRGHGPENSASRATYPARRPHAWDGRRATGTAARVQLTSFATSTVFCTGLARNVRTRTTATGVCREGEADCKACCSLGNEKSNRDNGRCSSSSSSAAWSGVAASSRSLRQSGRSGGCPCFAKRKRSECRPASPSRRRLRVGTGSFGGGGIRRRAAAHVARNLCQDPGAHPPHGRADGRGAALPGTAAAGADQGDEHAPRRNALNSPGARPIPLRVPYNSPSSR